MQEALSMQVTKNVIELHPDETVKIEPLNKAVINEFIESLDVKKKSDKTKETYTNALNQFLRYIKANGITRPRESDIVAYRGDLEGRGLANTSISSYLTVVRLFFEFTAYKEYYPNVAEHVESAKISKFHKKDILAPHQFERILNVMEQNTQAELVQLKQEQQEATRNAVKQNKQNRIDLVKQEALRNRAIIEIALSCALRMVEISRADIQDLTNKSSGTVLYIQRKGETDKNYPMPIPEPLEKTSREYLSTRGRLDDTAPLFASTSNRNKGGRMTTQSLSRIIKTAFRNAGYDSDRLTAHSLRHTAITAVVKSTKDVTVAQQFAGHSNVETTMTYYHANEIEANPSAEIVNNLFFNTKKAD